MTIPTEPAPEKDARYVTVTAPNGRTIRMDGWHVAAIITLLMRDESAVYKRLNLAALTDEPQARPGRPAGGGQP